MKNADLDFIDFIYENCINLTNRMHGIGIFSLAVNSHRPKQLAFSWVSSADDLVLIFPTHSKIKNELSRDDFKNLRESISWSFENKLFLAILKNRSVSYKFLRIEKIFNEFRFSLSDSVGINLWLHIFDGELRRPKYSKFNTISEMQSEIVAVTRSKILGVAESHEYKIPLNRISQKVKDSILKNGYFPRLAPHGHTYRVNEGKIFERSSDDSHPSFRRIIDEYKGRAFFSTCSACKSSMIGFKGESICALCSRGEIRNTPEDVLNFDQGPNHFGIRR